MTFTNEPGIYIRLDALDIAEDPGERTTNRSDQTCLKIQRHRCAHHDDMLITPAKWMTAAFMRSIADIEAFIAKACPTLTWQTIEMRLPVIQAVNPPNSGKLPCRS
jgi:hypothetical protein